MKFNALLVSAAMMVMTLAACGDDDPVNPDNNQGGNEDTETVEGDVEVNSCEIVDYMTYKDV